MTVCQHPFAKPRQISKLSSLPRCRACAKTARPPRPIPARGCLQCRTRANASGVGHRPGGYSSVVEQQPSKLNMRVRFPLPAPVLLIQMIAFMFSATERSQLPVGPRMLAGMPAAPRPARHRQQGLGILPGDCSPPGGAAPVPSTDRLR